ncbi:hypothetical protein FOL47_001125 [Perkinsus chesapeaki]|uniref:Uncharacterized protein n=1 Tax=Perkinsus chesapeaki TaxID=330153 RepID=A0A7J6MK94_PERCH|nr:hypothetical protein FOL47_001125 [Perkinsus chesapeaki]
MLESILCPRIGLIKITGGCVYDPSNIGPSATYECKEFSKEDAAQMEATIKARLGMLPAPAQFENKGDASGDSSAESAKQSESSTSRSSSPEVSRVDTGKTTKTKRKAGKKGKKVVRPSSRSPTDDGGFDETSESYLDKAETLSQEVSPAPVEEKKGEEQPSKAEEVVVPDRSSSFGDEDPSPTTEDDSPAASVDTVFKSIASAETESIADRVTVDVGLFMHFVDSYSVSGDNLKRISLCNEIEHAITNFHPYNFPQSHIKTIVFGSYAYNLHLPWASDLDFVLIPSRQHHRHRGGGGSPSSTSSGASRSYETPSTAEDRLKLLYLVAQHLERRLSQGVLVSTPVVIASSRVPLLTLQCKGPAQTAAEKKWCSTCDGGFSECCPLHSPVKVQISVAGPAHSGIETSAYVAMLCQHYDCLRPLVLVIKHILVCDGLVTPYDGGMSSYTLVLMVVSFLNQFYGNDGHRRAALGQLLLSMLYWYGGEDEPSVEASYVDPSRQFKDKVHLIMADGACLQSFSSSRLAIRPVAVEPHTHYCERSEDPILSSRFATDMMVILDPLALNGDYVNLGQSVWRWPAVAAAFRNARRSLECGGWYGLATPTVWVAARRAGFPSPNASAAAAAEAIGNSSTTARRDSSEPTATTGASSVSSGG